MKNLRRQGGFTLIELLVVILILAILMAIALPLYLRAVRDSEKQTCRSNMQTIANAEQAHRVRVSDHTYTTDLSTSADATTLCGSAKDLQQCPRCPTTTQAVGVADYAVVQNDDGSITITCISSAGDATAEPSATHNVNGTATPGFTPGIDSQ